MDSAHAEAAVLLISAGADRTRVRIHQTYPHGAVNDRGNPPSPFFQENLDGETPENIPGVGGQEQKLARQHVIDHCGKP
jgi:26S proteasome non-ATPase regulatory subunit 10